MTTTTTLDLGDSGLLRLLQLCSPALPIGMYAYSQGMEHAVEIGAVADEESAATWIMGLLSHALRAVDVPILARLHAAWRDDDGAAVRRWNDLLWASRGARELQDEDQRLGSALARVLVALDVGDAATWISDPRATYANLFARAAVSWDLPARAAAFGYLFSWAEAQIGAATRLIPLGQTASQRILSRAVTAIPAAVDGGLSLPDGDIGFSAPAHVIGCALHETQYSRLFRS
ncbi:MAG TPA: urease accessory UreF family protein [Polyangia bacterium]|nr:urease accessory UreF family protein [Polyangia bacterium]